jgi:hypothetical protein
MRIILILILFLILFFYIKSLTNNEEFFEDYKSTTKIEGAYEIYSETDKFYPSYKISVKKRDQFKKLLKYADDFFTKNDINYSLIYGSLLGYSRNKKIIPYDEDADCIIGSESVNKLIKLAENEEIKDVIFNDEIKIYKPNFKSDKIDLILNKSLLTNNGFGERYNCKGEKGSSSICAFKGLFGRFILKNYYYDIFPFNTNLSILKKYRYYPEKLSSMSVLKNDIIERNKFDDINVSVLKNPLSIELLKLTYGENFMKPSK